LGTGSVLGLLVSGLARAITGQDNLHDARR
jgi:hypothetical protein